jgi:hypothetical protein
MPDDLILPNSTVPKTNTVRLNGSAPPLSGSGKPKLNDNKISVPVVKDLATVDSIINQPHYAKTIYGTQKVNTIDDVKKAVVPSDITAAMNYVKPVIQGYMSKLDPAFAEYKKNNPTATELPADEAAKALGGNDAYQDYINHINMSNKIRSKTALAPREANQSWGMIGYNNNTNPNGGGTLVYGNTTPYDATLQNYFTPYKTATVPGALKLSAKK